ncbi:TetR/AcrR family transcriptional regulator [Streptomyces fuscichromogenes]|uniref:TetR family transcriptional regulator n=1 Tax=Streptomyces fuscichromogenes TaxID=1324013 RepID=A0A918CWN9_9ACTN|nr:TetR/AcrR family transcriptional regulator [Streptomyces fuscichromogenes]GGN40699.1 TetR family transcriptional regulator [Streptomyces fuscichromogenes]
MTQERAVRTRQQVLDAAAEEFAAHGYLGTTLLDVIRHTGMTKGALYGHFSSKEELAAALIEEAGGELSRRAARAGEPDTAAVRALRETVLDLARHLREDTRARSALRLAVESPHLDRHDLGLVQRICLSLGDAVTKAQAGDASTGGYPPEAVARLLVSVFFGVPHPVPDDDTEAARQFDDLWAAVSGPPRDGWAAADPQER